MLNKTNLFSFFVILPSTETNNEFAEHQNKFVQGFVLFKVLFTLQKPSFTVVFWNLAKIETLNIFCSGIGFYCHFHHPTASVGALRDLQQNALFYCCVSCGIIWNASFCDVQSRPAPARGTPTLFFVLFSCSARMFVILLSKKTTMLNKNLEQVYFLFSCWARIFWSG